MRTRRTRSSGRPSTGGWGPRPRSTGPSAWRGSGRGRPLLRPRPKPADARSPLPREVSGRWGDPARFETKRESGEWRPWRR
eukprot:11189210-Lingulodinium_polyedra.AAC.1